ncbi:glycosyltransferase, partial [Providencia rettgeri]|uniref:glycosyltransferase n=1 Tax=Providencia rettgeri TaxID=587 RepID=UPI001C8388E9
TGTASEWQGAEVFVRAIARLQTQGSPLRLVFLGQGTAIPGLRALAAELAAPVEFHDPVPPSEAASWLRGASVGLASIRPGAGYDFAYPAKIFAAWGCGGPVVYAGPGPARGVLAGNRDLGEGVEFDAAEIASAIERVVKTTAHTRADVADWAAANVSLKGVADRAVSFTHRQLETGVL